MLTKKDYAKLIGFKSFLGYIITSRLQVGLEGSVVRNKMSGIHIKNHGKKPRIFLKGAEKMLFEITGKKMKNIPCQQNIQLVKCTQSRSFNFTGSVKKTYVRHMSFDYAVFVPISNSKEKFNLHK